MTSFSPDDRIGVYRIVRSLGRGGMGAVYEVEHVKLGVHYALKTFSLSEGSHADILKGKFLAEGKVLARLHDPRIVRVFDLNFDEQTQTLYFVMDIVLYKDGNPHTLADVKTSDLEERFVHQWFVELAAALDYIHAQGIVHRDIKLSNVLLNAERHVILSDFGVSRLLANNHLHKLNADQTIISAAPNSRLVMGTHGYMAPEVERGEEATTASDTYSLAVMIVYLLTGVWYECGSKVLKLLDTFELPWSQVLPPMLSEDPAKRPSDLSALARKLDAQVSAPEPAVRAKDSPVAEDSGSDGIADPPRRMPKKLSSVISAGIVALAAACIAAVCFLLRNPERPTPVKEDFARMFGPEGIFEVRR